MSQPLAKLVHALRVTLVVALLWSIPSPAARRAVDTEQPPAIETIRKVLPAAADIDTQSNREGFWAIRDSSGVVIARAARTLPTGADAIGYRGPTESVIIVDDAFRIMAVRLLQSSDTQEHVDAVVRAPKFWKQFDGWDWDASVQNRKIDGVSGATLTSLAAAEGIIIRMGGQVSSLIFGEQLSVDEIQDWFPTAVTVETRGGMEVALDASGMMVGRVIRSGRFSDDLVGYQGPTELLMRIDPDEQVSAMRIRSSYDNEPYVDYVRQEKYSWNQLQNRSLTELAQFDPKAAGVEGVSGATMTSLAVADTAVAAAKGALIAEAEAAANQPGRLWETLSQQVARVRWTRLDTLTLVTLLTAGLLSQLGMFHRRSVRRVWLLGVIGVIGLWAGNLISLALIAGWSAEGIAWRLAPGLTAIAVVALVMPPLTKSNPYCNHLCPHGAWQQLIKPANRSQRKWQPSPQTSRWLARVPGATLVAAYLALITTPTIDLSSWEPFHAYLFRIASWGAIGLCGLTLLIAAFLPMGYCRFGCPTGRLIDYLRRHARSGKITGADVVAGGLLVLAVILASRSN